ncbi:hypothetical protein PoB_003321600 [Plakobranchus ocellatus]|uniref:SMB domain-containing protein n=1 Tax=Plakobranchus ocellatus TaxID=259542 RepID=A0AAV4AEI1_9GAST|nr:hypothetical protein PoB_003321600 [Plakobranchus ocellatus]
MIAFVSFQMALNNRRNLTTIITILAITQFPLSDPFLTTSPDMSKAYTSAKSSNTTAVTSEFLDFQTSSMDTENHPPTQWENTTFRNSNLSNLADKSQVLQENEKISYLATNKTNRSTQKSKSFMTGLARIGADESLERVLDSCHEDIDILNKSMNSSAMGSPSCTLKQIKKERMEKSSDDGISEPPMNSLEPDPTLTFTCEDRCGKELSFPCSCSASCVVYGTCCDNLTQHCPHVWEEGMTRFGHMLGADTLCHEDFAYIISSCPSSPRKNADGKEVTLSTVQKPVLKNVNISLESHIPKSDRVGTTLRTRDISGLDSEKISKLGREVQRSIVERLKLALSAAPVTDLDTGFTFINKSIYDCNNMSQSTALVWSVASAWTDLSPVMLEDLDRFDFLNHYQFEFDHEIFKAHQCLTYVVETCKQTKGLSELNQIYAEKCQKSRLALIMSRLSKTVLYRNIFCGYCNEGRHDKYSLVVAEELMYRQKGFQVLMSFSESGTINVRLFHPGSAREVLSWSQAHCPIPDHSTGLSVSSGLIEEPANAESDRQAVCSTTCLDNYFKALTDGVCKAEHRALLAIADDGLPPLCPSAMKGLANFLVCGLKSEAKTLSHTDWSSESVSVMFDTSTNKILYVIEINLALIARISRVFSNRKSDVIPNLYHVAILVKSFNNYRSSHDLCSGQNLGNQNLRSGIQEIRTSPIESYVSRLRLNLTEGMEQLRGPVVSKQSTTTVCLTPVYFAHTVKPDYLKCMEDPERERDKSLLHDFQSSPCFSHIENLEMPDSNGADTVQKRDAIHLMCVLPLIILMMLFVKDI